MKLLVIAAIIVAVASSPLTEVQKWPWQVGKVYRYDVDCKTYNKFEQNTSDGMSIKGQFVIRVKAPGHLLAKFENPLHTLDQLNKDDLKYHPIESIDEHFEIFVDGGRVNSIKVPESVPLPERNILKGLVSALQVDISSYRYVLNHHNYFDIESFQGVFNKMETDVTNDCETLYSISPMSSEWRKELPMFANEEDPVEIVKSRDFDKCNDYPTVFKKVPEKAVNNDKKHFIKHTSESRIVAGRQGTIYKSEVIDSILVNPLIFGKQKAEVQSFVKLHLNSIELDNDTDCVLPENMHQIDSLYSPAHSSHFFNPAKDDLVANAQQILQDMVPTFQDLNNISQTDFLLKFNTFVRILSVMTEEQLKQVTNSTEVSQSPENKTKWILYRDAIAQLGSATAFQQIKSWILSETVQEEEAAELITSFASTLQESDCDKYSELLITLFNFSMDPEIMQHNFLNNSVLLAATKSMRFNEEYRCLHSVTQDIKVNKLFCFSTEKTFIIDTVLPFLSQKLREAIESGESNKAQSYVRALANLAHPNIIKIFAPYLDGSVTVSKYLRIQMITSLRSLVNVQNENARLVLFSILRNTAEDYEVRVAAALNIFMAFPTLQMMQVMAHMTNDDPSIQVRAVLANSITFASGLKDPRFKKLATAAKSVMNIITKQKLGYRYSTSSMIDEYTSDDDFSFFRELSYIGSENNLLPKYQRSALRFRNTASTEEQQITLSVSNVQQLIDYLVNSYYEAYETDAEFKFSAEKIEEILNIKHTSKDPLEGALFVEVWNQQKLITFTETELKAFVANAMSNMRRLMMGVGGSYTKVLSQKSIVYRCTLAMGIPFTFEYSEPTVLSMGINSNVKLFSGSMNNEVRFTYARNMDGRVGFVDTISESFVTTGVVNKFQVNTPFRLRITYKSGGASFTFTPNSWSDINLIHLSVWPYVAVQKQNSLLTIFEEATTRLIERPSKVVSTDVTYGECVGFKFELKGYSYSSDYKNIMNLLNDNVLSSIGTLLYQKDIALTNFDLKYLSRESKNKDTTISVFYQQMVDQWVEGEMGPATYKNDMMRAELRRKLVEQAASGIAAAKVILTDINVSFEGAQTTNFALVSAFAFSNIDTKLQIASFLRAAEQINAVFRFDRDVIIPLNFEKILNHKIKNKYSMDVKIGNESSIYLEGSGQRTDMYTQMLSNDPKGKQCLLDSANGNFYQKDCYEMIIKAHAPDFFKGTVTCTGTSNKTADLTSYLNIYQKLKNIYSWEEQISSMTIDADNKIDYEVQAFYYDALFNYQFTTKYGTLKLQNVKGMEYYPYYVGNYMPISSWERARNWFTFDQNLPYCAVDDNKIWTFSGRSYNYSLTSSWHVVMVDKFVQSGPWTDLVILAGKSSDELEVYIAYKSKSGKTLEMNITAATVEVESNAAMIADKGVTIYWNYSTKTALLEYFTSTDDEGLKIFKIDGAALRLIYDGQRLVIFTDAHRSTTKGICGQSTSEPRDDYMTPWGLVDLPEYYGASFSIDDDLSDPNTVELKKEAKLKAYQPATKFTKIFYSEES